MSIEAMKQWLEALEDTVNGCICRNCIKQVEAITSLRQAIEQAEKQVIFKIYKPTLPRGAIPNVRDAELPWVYDQDPSSGNVASMWVTPVKAAPQPQEFVCSTGLCHYKPQREWVGLTQQDIDIAFDDTQEGGGFNEFARAIEQTLKGKNT